jgi:hypothetical protein
VGLTLEPTLHVVIVVAQEFAARLKAKVPLHRSRLQSGDPTQQSVGEPTQ